MWLRNSRSDVATLSLQLRGVVCLHLILAGVHIQLQHIVACDRESCLAL